MVGNVQLKTFAQSSQPVQKAANSPVKLLSKKAEADSVSFKGTTIDPKTMRKIADQIADSLIRDKNFIDTIAEEVSKKVAGYVSDEISDDVVQLNNKFKKEIIKEMSGFKKDIISEVKKFFTRK